MSFMTSLLKDVNNSYDFGFLTMIDVKTMKPIHKFLDASNFEILPQYFQTRSAILRLISLSLFLFKSKTSLVRLYRWNNW